MKPLINILRGVDVMIPSIEVKGKAKPIDIWLYKHKKKS